MSEPVVAESAETPDTLLTIVEVGRRLEINNRLLGFLIEQSDVKVFPFKKRSLIAVRDLPILQDAKKAWDDRPRIRRDPVRRVGHHGRPVPA